MKTNFLQGTDEKIDYTLGKTTSTCDMKTIKEWKKEFDLFWGFAPEGTLKYRKGKDTWEFFENEILKKRDEEIVGMLEGMKKIENGAVSEILFLEGYNQALDQAIKQLTTANQKKLKG